MATLDEIAAFINGNVPDTKAGVIPEPDPEPEEAVMDAPDQPIEEEGVVHLIKEVDPELEKLLEDAALEDAADEAFIPALGPPPLPDEAPLDPVGIAPPVYLPPQVQDAANQMQEAINNILGDHLAANQPPEEPAEELPVYNCFFLWDTDHPKRGKAVIQDNGDIIFYLPEGIVIQDTIFKEIHKNVVEGNKEFPAFKSLKITVDPASQRACKFLSPTLGLAKDTGAVVAENFEFERPFTMNCTCSNPTVVKQSGQVAPPCPFQTGGQILTRCTEYIPEPYVVERAVYSQDTNKSLLLRRTRRNYGVVEYSIQLVDEGDHDKEPEIVGQALMHAGLNKDSVDTLWNEVMETHKDSFQNSEDIAHKFAPEVKPKESYLTYVLAE